jgi:hypothetical protein
VRLLEAKIGEPIPNKLPASFRCVPAAPAGGCCVAAVLRRSGVEYYIAAQTVSLDVRTTAATSLRASWPRRSRPTFSQTLARPPAKRAAPSPMPSSTAATATRTRADIAEEQFVVELIFC